MPRSPREYLQHIRDETSFLQATTRELDFASFRMDAVVTRACIRSLEVIGEAVKQMPEEVRHQAPTIEWRLIARMRDHLIHRYFGIDLEIVRDVLTHHIAALDLAVTQLLTQYENQADE